MTIRRSGKRWISALVLAFACAVALAQTEVGPQYVYDAAMSGSCYISGYVVQVNDGSTDAGKTYCCTSGTWQRCPEADTSAELAADITDERGTDYLIFSNDAVMDSTFTVRDSATNNALHVTDGGLSQFGDDAGTDARVNIEAGGPVQPVAPDASPHGTPWLWMDTDDITGYADEGDCVYSGCLISDKGDSSRNNYQSGKETGDWPFLYQENELNGHPALLEKAHSSDYSLWGINNIVAEVDLADVFTVAVVYDTNGATQGQVPLLGAGHGQSSNAYVGGPGAHGSNATCGVRTEAGALANMGGGVASADGPKIAIIRRDSDDLVDCYATDTNASNQPTVWGSTTEVGNVHAQALLSMNSTVEAQPNTQLFQAIVYKAYLTDVERDQLYQWLAQRYGLTEITDSSSGEIIAGYTDGGASRVFRVGATGAIATGDGIDSIEAQIHAMSETEQLRLCYDSDSCCSLTVDVNGDLDFGGADCDLTSNGSSIGSSGGGRANYSQAFTSQTAVTLTHNLATQNVLVVCYDSSDQQIGADDVTIGASDPWNTTVNFTSAQTGRCVVNGNGGDGQANYSQAFTSETAVTLTHNLGTPNVLAACYDSSDQHIGADDVTIGGSDPWDVTVNFETAQTGRCVVNGRSGGRYVETFTAQTTVTVTGTTHGLGTPYVDVECFDDSSPRERVEPDLVTVADSTHDVVITFFSAETGRCVLQ